MFSPTARASGSSLSSEGGLPVDYFVSHFWGHPFQDFQSGGHLDSELGRLVSLLQFLALHCLSVCVVRCRAAAYIFLRLFFCPGRARQVSSEQAPPISPDCHK